ncbi:MAG: hypothetical protein MJD61_00560, partial [Proteobacteria bacterium]|nr:hypothetical protein [Pseudomonadota bacterium]
IWERVEPLVEALGIERHKVAQVVDYYHATEKLNEIAAIPVTWSKSTKSVQPAPRFPGRRNRGCSRVPRARRQGGRR